MKLTLVNDSLVSIAVTGFVLSDTSYELKGSTGKPVLKLKQHFTVEVTHAKLSPFRYYRIVRLSITYF